MDAARSRGLPPGLEPRVCFGTFLMGQLSSRVRVSTRPTVLVHPYSLLELYSYKLHLA
jgi:hypothetical protein